MIGKIREIMETGKLIKVNRFNDRKETSICRELEKVWGVGTKKAK